MRNHPNEYVRFKRIAFGLWLFAILGPSTLHAADSFADVPNVEVIYYDVSGGNAAQIRSAINKARPVLPESKKAFDGRTEYKFNWRWPNRNGKCDLSQTKVEYQAKVTLPRLTNYATLPAKLQQQWDRYLAALTTHERGHVLIGHLQTEKLLAAIKGATCETVGDAAEAVSAEAAKSNVEYDDKTKHGHTQGAIFP